MNSTGKLCPKCSGGVESSMNRCPTCGCQLKKPNRRSNLKKIHWGKIYVGVIIGIGIIILLAVFLQQPSPNEVRYSEYIRECTATGRTPGVKDLIHQLSTEYMEKCEIEGQMSSDEGLQEYIDSRGGNDFLRYVGFKETLKLAREGVPKPKVKKPEVEPEPKAEAILQSTVEVIDVNQIAGDYVQPIVEELHSRLKSKECGDFIVNGRKVYLYTPTEYDPDMMIEVSSKAGEKGEDELRRAILLLEKITPLSLADNSYAQGLIYVWNSPSRMYFNCYLGRKTWKSTDWSSIAGTSKGRSQYPRIYEDWRVDRDVYSVWSAMINTGEKVLKSDDPNDLVLDTCKGGIVYCAVTNQAFEELIKAIGREDFHILGELILGGLVLEIPSGTAARHIEGGFTHRVVRVSEGKFSGEKVWVFSEWVFEK